MNCGHCNGLSSALRKSISIRSPSQLDNSKDSDNEEAQNFLSVFAALEMIFERPILQERTQDDHATTELNICENCGQSLSALILAYQEFLQIRHELAETTRIFRRIDKIRSKTIPPRKRKKTKQQKMGISEGALSKLTLGKYDSEEHSDFNYSGNISESEESSNKSRRTRRGRKSTATKSNAMLEELKEPILKLERVDFEAISKVEEDDDEIEIKIEPVDLKVFENEDEYSDFPFPEVPPTPTPPSPPYHDDDNLENDDSNDTSEESKSDDHQDSEDDGSNHSEDDGDGSDDEATRLYACEIDSCLRRFNTHKSLRIHQGHSHKHRKRTELQCPSCPEILSSSAPFMEHVVQSHPDLINIKPRTESEEPSSSKKKFAFKCTLCSKHYVDDTGLLLHLRRMHCKLKEFKCPQENCGKSFCTMSELEGHVNIVHEGKGDKFICELCGEEFLYESNLKKHLKSKKKHKNITPRPKNCPICFKQFKSTQYVEIHVKTVHRGERPPKMFPCTYPGCGLVVNYKPNLIKHMLIHTPREHKFPCTICDKKFLSEEGVRKHIKRHTAVRRPYIYPCTNPDCGKVFNEQRALRKHLITHEPNREPRHPCTHSGCDKIFITASGLRQHIVALHRNLGWPRKRNKQKSGRTNRSISIVYDETPVDQNQYQETQQQYTQSYHNL